MPARANHIGKYFKNIFSAVVTTVLGMKLTAKYLVSKPVTMLYPEQKPAVPAGARGLHKFVEEQCLACMQCVKVCPVDCITIEMLGRGKEALMTRYDIDYQKCLFCNLCCEVCPTEAIVMTELWDLCAYSRDDCVVRFARPKSEEEIEQYQAEMAAKETEKKRKLAEAAAAKQNEEEKKPAEI